jgi:hypothetical protein
MEKVRGIGTFKNNIFHCTVLTALLLLLVNQAAQAKLEAAAASANSVTLHWTAPGDDNNAGTASQYDVRYSTSPITDANWDAASQASGEPTPQAAGTAESFTVTGLTAATNYYFAIKTADEVPNWSALSNVVMIATDQETTAPAAVADLSTPTVTSTSVTLQWTCPGDDGSVGLASSYDIRYATVAITDANWNSASQISGEPSPLIAGSTQSYTVTGLNPNTTYYFAMKTADEVPNWSNLSNVASTTTGAEQNPPAAVANLTVVLPTQNSLTLVWLAPGDDSMTGTASQYDIRYSTSTITMANWGSATQVSNEPTPHPAGTPESLTVANLNLNTTYYFALRTADEVPNWSGLSNVASGATTPDQTPPAAINDLQAASGSADGQINLGWTAPGDDGTTGRASLYEIRYSRNILTAANWSTASVLSNPPLPQTAGTWQTTTLSGLTPGEMYWIGIKSYDEAANSSPMSNCDTAIAKLDIISGTDDNDNGLPLTYKLSQNYPNPFNPTTAIDFSVPRSTRVQIEIFNIRGERVATLADREYAAGSYTVAWDGNSETGSQVSTGVYFYRLLSDNFSDTRKMVYLK